MDGNSDILLAIIIGYYLLVGTGAAALWEDHSPALKVLTFIGWPIMLPLIGGLYLAVALTDSL